MLRLLWIHHLRYVQLGVPSQTCQHFAGDAEPRLIHLPSLGLLVLTLFLSQPDWWRQMFVHHCVRFCSRFLPVIRQFFFTLLSPSASGKCVGRYTNKGWLIDWHWYQISALPVTSKCGDEERRESYTYISFKQKNFAGYFLLHRKHQTSAPEGERRHTPTVKSAEEPLDENVQSETILFHRSVLYWQNQITTRGRSPVENFYNTFPINQTGSSIISAAHVIFNKSTTPALYICSAPIGVLI